MARISAWVGDDQKEWVEDESQRLEIGQAELIRQLIDAAREHGTESVLNNNTESTLNKELNNTESVFNRLDELEAKIDKLASASESSGEKGSSPPPTPQNGSDPPEMDSSPETMDSPDRSDQTTGSVGVDTGETTDEGQHELIEAFRGYLETRSPKKLHAKDATARALELLRKNGTMATGELKDALYEEYGQHYGGKKAMWESFARYLDELPGFADGGYGAWKYAGDDELRAALAGDSDIYDPTGEF